MIVCTGITYTDKKKEIRYFFDPVVIGDSISVVSFPELSESQIEEIQRSVPENVQDILSKYF